MTIRWFKKREHGRYPGRLGAPSRRPKPGAAVGAQPPQRSRPALTVTVTHHLVHRGHQHTQGGEHYPQKAELHVVVGVEENTQRDGDLCKGHGGFRHGRCPQRCPSPLPSAPPPPHQGQLDPQRESLAVSHALDDHDDRRGHGLGQLVGTDGVALQGEVGEDDEAAEAEGQRQHLRGLQALGGEGAERLAQVEAEPGDGEVHQGQAEVGEAQPHVQPFVQEDDADGGGQIDQQPRGQPALRRQPAHG